MEVNGTRKACGKEIKNMREVSILPTTRQALGKITIAKDEIRVYIPEAWSDQYTARILSFVNMLRNIDVSISFRAKSIREGQYRFTFISATKNQRFTKELM
jgi:hypothetical protein